MNEELERLEKLIEDAEKKRRFHDDLLIAWPVTLKLMKEGRPSHPLAGKTAKLKSTGAEIEVEDWFEKIFGIPYLVHDLDRPAFVLYFCRMGIDHSVPVDNDVVCVKSHGSGGLLHDSEIEEINDGGG